MFCLDRELVIVGEGLPRRLATSQRCTAASKVRRDSNVDQREQASYQQLVGATTDFLLKEYFVTLVKKGDAFVSQSSRIDVKQRLRRNPFKQGFHAPAQGLRRPQYLFCSRMIGWQERIALLGDQAGLSEIESIEKKIWDDESQSDLPDTMLDKTAMSGYSQSEKGSDYQNHIDELINSPEPTTSVTLPPITSDVTSASTKHVSNSIPHKVGSGGVELPRISLTQASSKTPSSSSKKSSQRKDQSQQGRHSSLSRTNSKGTLIKMKSEGSQQDSRSNSRAGGNSAVRLTKSELARLQRIRSELVNRNKYLLGEIAKEKKNFEAIYPAHRIEALRNRNQNLQTERAEISEKRDELKSSLQELEEELKREKINLQAVANIQHSSKARLKNFEQVLERGLEESSKIDRSLKCLAEEHEEAFGKLNHLELQEKEFEEARLESNAKQREVDDRYDRTCMLVREARQAFNKSTKERAIKMEALTRSERKKAKALEKVDAAEVLLSSLCQEVDETKSTVNQLKGIEDIKRCELKEAEHGIKQMKQHKANMKTAETQTSTRLVIVRDIAWIRVAEEEVVISPFCNEGSRPSTTRSRADDSLPIGTKVPVFEFFDCKNVPDSEKGFNKDLCEAKNPLQYIWVGEEGK